MAEQDQTVNWTLVPYHDLHWLPIKYPGWGNFIMGRWASMYAQGPLPGIYGRPLWLRLRVCPGMNRSIAIIDDDPSVQKGSVTPCAVGGLQRLHLRIRRRISPRCRSGIVRLSGDRRSSRGHHRLRAATPAGPSSRLWCGYHHRASRSRDPRSAAGRPVLPPSRLLDSVGWC